MSVRLKAGEKLSRGIRRTTRKQLHRVLARLDKAGTAGRGESLHRARQGLKKVRSVLRLLRPALGRKAWRQEDRVFRDAGKALSPSRDAEVLLAALVKLRREHGLELGEKIAAELEKDLRARHHQATRDLPQRAKQCQSKLSHACRHIEDWPMAGLTWRDIGKGLKRAYKRGLAASQLSARTHNLADLHEWRKRVKDLWHHLRLLRSVSPEVPGGYAKQMKDLGSTLGEDHDLAMLETAITTAARPPERFSKHALKPLLEAIHSRRARLQHEAFDAGRRLFRQKPAEFARAFGHHKRHSRRA